MTARFVLGVCAAVLLSAPAAAQQPALPDAAAPDNPYERRPVCASMFMKTDWQLTKKQRICDWIHDGVFSTNAMLGAAWSAGFSMYNDSESEAGDPFLTRFGRKFGQNACKSTGAYVGGLIFREDPRKRPPYLAIRTTPPPRGFFRRVGYALGTNFISYRCVASCSSEADIRKVPALSRITGSIASGYASELLTTDRPNDHVRAWRGAASAYASTFTNSLFVEFKPELSAIAGRTARALGIR